MKHKVRKTAGLPVNSAILTSLKCHHTLQPKLLPPCFLFWPCIQQKQVGSKPPLFTQNVGLHH